MTSEITLATGKIDTLTALADGTFITIWNAPGNIPTAQVYNLDGTKKGVSFAIAPGSNDENINFTATSLSNGRFAVVWQQKGAKDAVYARVFETGGTPAGNAFKIASGDTAQTLPQVAAAADGGFVVATVNAGVATAVKVGGDGTMANALAIQDNALGVSITALKNGNLAAFVDVGVPGNHDMMGYILGPNGEVIGSGEVFSNIADIDPLSPDLASLSDGSFVLVWDASEGGADAIEFNHYLSTGASAGSGSAFSAGTGQTLGPHTVEALPGGGFVFAYEQGGSGGKDVYAGWTSSNSFFFLDSETVGFNNKSGDQTAPKIAVLGDGRYVVSWTNAVNGVVETHAQIFDPRTRAVNWTGKEIGEQYQGTAYDDTLNGGGGDDTIFGDNGWDTLNGGSGRDTLQGGDGSDAYVVDDAGDQVIETATGGASDTVYTSIAYTLDSNVENLTAAGAEAVTLTGNAVANVVRGNAGANKVNGGYGKDTLYGGTGKDIFVFDTKLSSGNADKIADYKASDDTIWLENKYLTKLKAGKLASSAFWKGAKAHDSNDRIIYDSSKGYLYYDADGTGASKQVLIATMTKKLKMTYAEFFVI